MNIKPIRTKLDYQAALRAIEALMQATPGSPEGDRLDVLVTLVEAYERAHAGAAASERLGGPAL